MNAKLELTIVQMKLTVPTQQVDLYVDVELDLVEMEYSAQVNCYCQSGQLFLSYYDVFTLTGIKIDTETDNCTQGYKEHGRKWVYPFITNL